MRLAVGLLFLLTWCVSAPAADLDNLYVTSQWFRLRDAIAADPKAPEFYRGAVAAAFNDQNGAERYLNAAMKSSPDPEQRAEAGLLLQELYAINGRRRAAAGELEQVANMLRGQPAFRSYQQLRAELSILSGYPDQTVTSRRLSRIPYFQVDNQTLIPVNINGQPANYYIDTGAAESVIDESEAQRLGLTIKPAAIPLEPYGAHSDVTAKGVAVAHDVVIGNVHLRDVAFLVVKDQGYDGLLGLPVLVALQTLRWNSDGTLEIAFPPEARDTNASNLCFDGGNLVTETAFAGQKLSMFVDTGTYETLLFPTFTQQFRDTVAQGRAEPFVISDNNRDPDARTLSTLNMRVGGADVKGTRLHALSRNFTENGSWAHGNLGTDLLGNARSMTIDFAAMRLTIEEGGLPGDAASCILPSKFTCMAGFTCTVRYDPDVRCHVDRIPTDAPAGNPLPSPETMDAAASCALPSSFGCAATESCTAVFDGNGGCRIGHAERSRPAGAEARPTSTATLPPPAALPDARDIMERSLKFESLELAPAKDYVYTQETVQKLLDADGNVKKSSSETHEVMTLYDQRYERLTQKDGKPLPAKKELAEQERFDKAVDKRAHETPQAREKRQEAERKDAAHNLVCDTEFLKLSQFRLQGSGEVNGRPAWVVEVIPMVAAAPSCEELKTLAKMRLRIWIDQSEHRWAQVEADNIATVTWGKLLVRVPAGALHISFRQTRLRDGVWMAESLHARADVKLMVLAKLHIDMLETYRNYRKFQSDSRVVPLR